METEAEEGDLWKGGIQLRDTANAALASFVSGGGFL